MPLRDHDHTIRVGKHQVAWLDALAADRHWTIHILNSRSIPNVDAECPSREHRKSQRAHVVRVAGRAVDDRAHGARPNGQTRVQVAEVREVRNAVLDDDHVVRDDPFVALQGLVNAMKVFAWLEGAKLQRFRAAKNPGLRRQRLQTANGAVDAQLIEDVSQHGAGEFGAERAQNHAFALALPRGDIFRQLEIGRRIHVDALDWSALEQVDAVAKSPIRGQRCISPDNVQTHGLHDCGWQVDAVGNAAVAIGRRAVGPQILLFFLDERHRVVTPVARQDVDSLVDGFRSNEWGCAQRLDVDVRIDVTDLVHEQRVAVGAVRRQKSIPFHDPDREMLRQRRDFVRLCVEMNLVDVPAFQKPVERVDQERPAVEEPGVLVFDPFARALRGNERDDFRPQ